MGSLLGAAISVTAQESGLAYQIETGGTVSAGDYSPLWLNANRYGLYATENQSEYLQAGIEYNHTYRHDWRIHVGLDIATAINMTNHFWLQQAYADISTGWMTEGPNARPIPQIRIEIKDFLNIPGLGNWLAFKGHLAYGLFVDSSWQEDFVGNGNYFKCDREC